MDFIIEMISSDYGIKEFNKKPLEEQVSIIAEYSNGLMSAINNLKQLKKHIYELP